MPMPMPMFSERASVVMVIADRQAQVVQGTEQEQGHAPTASREPALPVTLLTCCSTILYESQGKIRCYEHLGKIITYSVGLSISNTKQQNFGC